MEHGLTRRDAALLTKLTDDLGTASDGTSAQLLGAGIVLASIEGALCGNGPGVADRDLALDVVMVMVLAGVSNGRSEKTGSGNSAGKLGDVNHVER